MGQACGHSILCRSQQYPAARPAEPSLQLPEHCFHTCDLI
uniref:Phosphodiesterase 2A n=1 Tax=Homo sapiens TaxID=9606 RepID=F5H2Z0_HUMAN